MTGVTGVTSCTGVEVRKYCYGIGGGEGAEWTELARRVASAVPN